MTLYQSHKRFSKQDLKALQEIVIEENGKRFAIGNQCMVKCEKVFQPTVSLHEALKASRIQTILDTEILKSCLSGEL